MILGFLVFSDMILMIFLFYLVPGYNNNNGSNLNSFYDTFLLISDLSHVENGNLNLTIHIQNHRGKDAVRFRIWMRDFTLRVRGTNWYTGECKIDNHSP